MTTQELKYTVNKSTIMMDMILGLFGVFAVIFTIMMQPRDPTIIIAGFILIFMGTAGLIWGNWKDYKHDW